MNYPQEASRYVADIPEILPGWTLRFKVHADGQGYDVRLQDMTAKQYGRTASLRNSATYRFHGLDPTSQVPVLIWPIAGSPIATLLHVAQNEEFEGDRSLARELRQRPALSRQPSPSAWPSREKGMPAAPDMARKRPE